MTAIRRSHECHEDRKGDLGDRPQRTDDGIDVLPLGGFLAALEECSLW